MNKIKITLTVLAGIFSVPGMLVFISESVELEELGAALFVLVPVGLLALATLFEEPTS